MTQEKAILEIETKTKEGPIAKSGPLHLWEHAGRIFCDGLFKMMDQEGFPLSDSLIQCAKYKWIPCMNQFRADALRAGWSHAKIDATIASAIADSSTFTQ